MTPEPLRTSLLAAGAVLAGAICWFVGMDAWHAGTVGLVLGAAGLCRAAVPDHRDVQWEGVARPADEGARWDVARLSWSLRPRRGRIPQAGLRPVHDLARYRLAQRGLDLDDPADRPAIERLLGEAAYATVALPATRPPRMRAVAGCLDALDRLDPPPQEENRHDR
ncbi:hypothetical protein [Pseudonocardia sp. DLS-67]